MTRQPRSARTTTKAQPGPAASADRRQAYSAPALEKGLDVIELLATLSEPLTASQIAQQLGRSLQEIYRVVLALERRGYIVRRPGEDFLILSSRLFSLGSLSPPFRRLIDAAQPILNAIALQSGQSVHMAVLDGTSMCIVAQVDSPAPIGVRLKVGAVSPAIRSASGRTLLAFQAPGVREWCLDAIARQVPKREMALAIERIEAIRARGYEIVEGDILPGVTDLSCPVIDSTGAAMAAVTTPFLTTYPGPLALDAATDLLHKAAAEITAIMGGTPAPPRSPTPAGPAPRGSRGSA